MLEHHARSLGGLARRVTDVEALDAQSVQHGLVGIQVQRFGQRHGAGRLGTGFAQGPRQGQFGVLLRLLQPGAPDALRTRQQARRLHARLFGQQAQQIAVGQRMRRHQHRRDQAVYIVLGYEGRQHVLGRLTLGVGRKERFVAQMPAAAHHGQVHADLAARAGHRDHVGVFGAVGVLHGLLVQHARERPHLIAQGRGLFEAQFDRGLLHARLDLAHHVLRLAVEKAHGALHIGRVFFLAQGLHARRRAAPDLMQQARPRAVGEHRVFAGPQAKDLLQYLDGLAHRPGVGIRAEIPAAARGGPAVIRNARPVVLRHLQIGVGLVVAKKNVVARVQALDEVVFQDQRFGLGARHRHLDPGHLGHHLRDARAGQRLLEIRGHALFQVARLAHVHDLASFVQMPVHARQMRKIGQELLEIEDVGHGRSNRED